MREPLQDFHHDRSPYERPTQRWICGWTSAGQPCRVGPSRKGRCRARYECEPLLKNADANAPRAGKKGDRWFCTRPKSAGGACDMGPYPDGTCARRITRCQPYRSLRSRRGLVTRAVASLTVGLGLLVLGGPQLPGLRMAVLSPGGLSGSHSAIETCAACHAGAGENADAFGAFPATVFSPPTAPGTTEQCLRCHRPVGADALGPHGLPPPSLVEVTERHRSNAATPWLSPALALATLGPNVPTNAEGELACSTCHVEHRGSDFDLTAMDDGRCQACHVLKLAGFAGDHPAFTEFPPGRTTSDYFQHGLHAIEMGTLPCADCHSPSAAGSEVLVGEYDAMCADCHVDDMRDMTPAFTGAPVAPVSRLTQFDHAPHLVDACSTCHQTESEPNFDPITKSMCATCHRPGKTTEACLTCHDYHAPRFQLTRTP